MPEGRVADHVDGAASSVRLPASPQVRTAKVATPPWGPLARVPELGRERGRFDEVGEEEREPDAAVNAGLSIDQADSQEETRSPLPASRDSRRDTPPRRGDLTQPPPPRCGPAGPAPIHLRASPAQPNPARGQGAAEEALSDRGSRWRGRGAAPRPPRRSVPRRASARAIRTGRAGSRRPSP